MVSIQSRVRVSHFNSRSPRANQLERKGRGFLCRLLSSPAHLPARRCLDSVPFCPIPSHSQPLRHFSQVLQLASHVLLAPLRSLRLPRAFLHPQRPRQQAFPPRSPRSARSSLPRAVRRLQRLRGLRRKRHALAPRVFDLPSRVLQELRAPATLPEG